MKTKNSALTNLISAGQGAELNAAGLRVWGDNWEAQFTDLGQDHDTFSGDVPAQVHELAVWDDASTRGEAQAIEQALHTPGPWTHTPSRVNTHPNTTRRDIVAESQFGPAFIAGDVSQSDASLIAAAPDLLQVVADYVLLCDLHDYVGAVPDAARQALRKAKGE